MKDINGKILSHTKNASKYADRWEKHSGKKDLEQMLYHSQKASKLKSIQNLNTTLAYLNKMKED